VEQQVVELHAQAAADAAEMCTVLWAVADAVLGILEFAPKDILGYERI
jgi:hypothetical protein